MQQSILKQEFLGLHDAFQDLMKSSAIKNLVRRVFDSAQAGSISQFRQGLIRWHSAVLSPELKKAYDRSLRIVRKDKAGTVSNRIIKNIDWSWIEEQGEAILTTLFLAAIASGGQAAYKIAGIGATFSAVNTNTLKAAEKACAKLVTEVTAKQKEAIKKLVKLAIGEGRSMTQLAASLKGTVGLHWRWTRAVYRFEWKLRDKGIPAEIARKRALKYKETLLNRRHEMIARTETAGAQSRGALIGYGDLGVKKVRFLAAPDACEECAAMDGRVYTISEAVGVIPVHPHGRCDYIAVTPPGGFRHPKIGKADKRAKYLYPRTSIEVNETELEKAIRAAFGSPGGKKFLARIIAAFIPEHKIYIESFIGGGAVLFVKEPSEREIINDLDHEIAFAYRFIKKISGEQFKALNEKNWKISKVKFDRLKKIKPSNDVERFYRFIYLTMGSYGYLREDFRGAEREIKICDRLERLKDRLSNVDILNKNYEELRDFDSPGSFYYLDPPYPKDTGEGTRISQLGEINMDRLYKFCRELRGKFILSLNDSIKNRRLFEKFEIKKVRTSHQLVEGGPFKHVRTELLISNFPLKTINLYIKKEDIEEDLSVYKNNRVHDRSDKEQAVHRDLFL